MPGSGRSKFAAVLLASFAACVPALAQTAPSATGPVQSPVQAPEKVQPEAPEFAGIAGWLNGGPLSMHGLRGKVVLVDFWAYSCINCIRTLPHLVGWQKQYGGKGLVVVGVHTPEFRFETDPANIASAIKRFGITYPVAEDNVMATWNAFHNQFWPAEYLVDRQGRIVYTHSGEGEYDKTEDAIRTALGNDAPVAADNGQDLSGIGSPEMYFGLARVANLASPETPRAGTNDYTAPDTLPLNRFALAGAWTLAPESATLAKNDGRITLHCHSGKVFMVASAAHPVTVAVRVDGKPQKPVTVRESRLYTLFDSTDYRDHTLELRIPKAGLQAFTFTFG